MLLNAVYLFIVLVSTCDDNELPQLITYARIVQCIIKGGTHDKEGINSTMLNFFCLRMRVAFSSRRLRSRN